MPCNVRIFVARSGLDSYEYEYFFKGNLMFSNSFLTASDKNRWNFKSSRISNSSHAIDELHPRYTGRRCSSFLLILSIRMSGIWLLEISRGHAMSIDIKKNDKLQFFMSDVIDYWRHLSDERHQLFTSKNIYFRISRIVSIIDRRILSSILYFSFH